MSLSVTHPDRLASLDQDAVWLYADDDIAGYARVVEQYGKDRRLLDPPDFQIQLLESADDFLKWVDEVLVDCPPDYWIAASWFKDMFCTPMFLHLACLRIALDGTSRNKHVVIVTRSAALAQQIRQLGGTPAAATAAFDMRAAVRWIDGWLHFLARPFLLYVRTLLAKLTLGNEYLTGMKKPALLVDTFLFAEDIAADGRFSDRFFPGLVDWFRQTGRNAASMPFTGNIPLRQLRTVYRRMKLSAVPFLAGEIFLGLADCLIGAWRTLCIYAQPPQFAAKPFGDIPIARIADHWWKQAALNTVNYQIWRRLPRRMADRGFHPETILEWYENQPLDKAITLGFRLDCRDATVIAVRQYFPAFGVVNFFSTSREVMAGASPKQNWACGKRIAELFARHDSVGHYKVVPALRYAHLFEPVAIDIQGEKLVIFLTSSYEESIGILESVFAAEETARCGFAAILIKPHQSLRGDIRAEAGQKWPASRNQNVSWTQQATRQLLDAAKLVVTAGSSVALEAVCRGVPVAVVGRVAGINLNPLETIDPRLWQLVYGAGDFQSLVITWLPGVPDLPARREIGLRIRGEYLQTPAPDSMLAFDPNRPDAPIPATPIPS